MVHFFHEYSFFFFIDQLKLKYKGTIYENPTPGCSKDFVDVNQRLNASDNASKQVETSKKKIVKKRKLKVAGKFENFLLLF